MLDFDVSVLIPVFNRARMLGEALESCRRQTLRPVRIIVADNCSTDDLRAVVGRFGDLPIEYFRHEHPVSPRDNFQSAADRCTTPYLKFLCSDNLLFPDTLENMMAAMRAAPNAGVCMGSFVEFIEDTDGGATVGKHVTPVLPAYGRFFSWLQLETSACSGVATTLYVTRCLREVGGFHPLVSAAFDWELYLAVIARFSAVKITAPVCAIRLHPEQFSKRVHFSEGAHNFNDVLMLTSQSANEHSSRLGLPPSQRYYLRQQIFWTALRHCLRSQAKLKSLRRWLGQAVHHRMILPLSLGVPFWLGAKAIEKLRHALFPLTSAEASGKNTARRRTQTLIEDCLGLKSVRLFDSSNRAAGQSG